MVESRPIGTGSRPIETRDNNNTVTHNLFNSIRNTCGLYLQCSNLFGGYSVALSKNGTLTR